MSQSREEQGVKRERECEGERGEKSEQREREKRLTDQDRGMK